MAKDFRDIEETFNRLKQKFRQGEISRREFIQELKKLQLQDSEGRFWMIGAQSGKWYYLDGKKWVRSDPPSITEGKAICIYCGFENTITANACARCGENLVKDRTEEDSIPPPASTNIDSKDFVELFEEKKGSSWNFRSVNPVSFFLFCGMVGLFIGIALGAFSGASGYFSSGSSFIPGFLKEFQGKLSGGIIFAVIGGAAGFLSLGILGFLKAIIINVILSWIGGIKIKISQQ